MGSQNGMDELEIIDADSQKVSAMLSALPRVEAPGNFEFRVKAGIANGSRSRFPLFPFLKVAAPLALVLVVVTFGLFYYQRPGGTDVDQIDRVAMPVPVTVPVLSPAQSEPVSAPSSTAADPTREVTGALAERTSAAPRRVKRTQGVVGSSLDNDGGNSIDRIIHPANVIMPPGFESANPQNRNANSTASPSANVPVREILDIFGIKGDFVDHGWRVRSVKENSQGSRAKIAPGDLIESIDGQPIGKDTKLRGGARTFTVRRDGKLITLSPGN